MLTEALVATVVVLLLSLYIRFKKGFNFWKSKDVPFPQPIFPTGNVLEILQGKTHFGLVMQKLYTQMKHVGDYCGIYFFSNPTLLVLSPEFAKTILVRDFSFFTDRGMFCNEKIDPLSANIFFLEGQRWKDLRAKLTPTFTSGKLKQMFLTVLDVGNRFVKHLKPLAEGSQDVEVYDLLARFNTDVISSCAFGLESNSLENPLTEFRTMGRKMLTFGKWKSLKIFFSMTFRNLAIFFKVRFNDKDVSDFFMNIVKQTIEHREKTGYQRKDFMQLLIDLMKKEESDVDKLTFNEIAAQAYVMYFAGFETSSTISCFTLHSLAHHQDIQEKARQSVFEVLKRFNNEWSYDAIMEMTYIEQLIDESMRLNPPVATLHRTATQDYKLPNGATIAKGTKVIIPNLAFQRDPELFPDPLKFDPERFNHDKKETRHSFSTLPFGEGPRYCIGMRFGYLQTKLGIAMLLANYKFLPCDRTDNPIEINPVTLIHGPSGEVWLNVSEISK